MGRAINKAITIAEIVKRRVPGLHQVCVALVGTSQPRVCSNQQICCAGRLPPLNRMRLLTFMSLWKKGLNGMTNVSQRHEMRAHYHLTLVYIESRPCDMYHRYRSLYRQLRWIQAMWATKHR
jgi:hypothetical protein